MVVINKVTVSFICMTVCMLAKSIFNICSRMAQENLKLCAAVKDLTHKLDIADECIKDYSERLKNAAIASQEGVTVEDEHRTVRFLKFPKGSAVN